MVDGTSVVPSGNLTLQLTRLRASLTAIFARRARLTADEIRALPFWRRQVYVFGSVFYRCFKTLAFTIACMWLLLMPVISMPLYHLILFHPYKMAAGADGPAEPLETKVEKVNFRSKSGTSLFGWYAPKKGADDVVLISHGNGGNILYNTWIVKEILGMGKSVFIYDYAGFGKSQGSPSIPGIVDDGIGAYDYLVKERHISPDHIILFGQSLGTGVTCQIARDHKYKAIILLSAYTSIKELGRERLPNLASYPDFAFPAQMLDSVSILAKPHPPLLMLHGQQDILIPITNARRLYQSASEPKTMIEFPHATHNDVCAVDHDLWESGIRKFLDSV